jgi:hypothetical protein
MKEEVKVERQNNITDVFTLILEIYHCAIKEWIKMNLVL